MKTKIFVAVVTVVYLVIAVWALHDVSITVPAWLYMAKSLLAMLGLIFVLEKVILNRKDKP